ncbi:MAG: putative Ntn-hydrolase superfamily protein [Gammaproteobacteria bacterium]|jgi:uncharacterized Ntn-hydrolase superfamily protein
MKEYNMKSIQRHISTNFLTLIYFSLVFCSISISTSTFAQEPIAWGTELEFHTFSIVAVDPRTGETGVAVTTRRPCVGNAVTWVRPGVGAVATQGRTRMEYGNDLLDLLERGVAPQDAMNRVVADDEGREYRQAGVIDINGKTAQWTGSEQYGEEANGDWVAMRTGTNYAVQGNSLVGTHVVDAVAESFERSEEEYRHLADRLIEAIYSGQVLGGDGRHGESQSAAVLVADPRPGKTRRPDQVGVDINVCEHSAPVVELRRIYDTISETLGFRELRQFKGNDIVQIKIILHALGYFQADTPEILMDSPLLNIYDNEVIAAVDRFRSDQGWGTAVSGYVDARTIDRLWSRLEEVGRAEEVRERIMAVARVDR